jgi:predicted MPP superfamily phosphohydrolase
MKKPLKIILITLSLLLLTAGGCLFYALKVEPYQLTVKQYNLNQSTKHTDAVKIVQFTDVHIKSDFTYQNLDKVVNAINQQNPDIVVFTGDLYDNYAKYNDDAHIIAELAKIKATTAKIAVWGNHDYGGGAVRQYQNIMSQANFTLLKNSATTVNVGNHTLAFAGLDDSMLGNPLPPATTNADYTIGLTHEPDAVNNFTNYNYDLTLSGHSHGGQVKIPFFPNVNREALAVTKMADQYSRGLYTLPNSSNQLYVNTGVGTTHISARFGTTPMIAVLNIYL